MRVISRTNASSLPIGGTEYVPGDDGVFDLPEALGAELTTRHASLWVTEQAARAAANAAEIERLRDPSVLPAVVAELLSRVAALETAAASKTKAPKTEGAAAPPAAPENSPTPPAAPKPSEAKAPVKRTAPKKTAASKPDAADATSSKTPPPEDPAAPPAE